MQKHLWESTTCWFRFAILILVISAVSVLFWYVRLNLVVDKCLDAGGKWDNITKTCVYNQKYLDCKHKKAKWNYTQERCE